MSIHHFQVEGPGMKMMETVSYELAFVTLCFLSVNVFICLKYLQSWCPQHAVSQNKPLVSWVAFVKEFYHRKAANENMFLLWRWSENWRRTFRQINQKTTSVLVRALPFHWSSPSRLSLDALFSALIIIALWSLPGPMCPWLISATSPLQISLHPAPSCLEFSGEENVM